MFKKFFNKAFVVVLAVMVSFTTLFSASALAVKEKTVMTVYTKNIEEEIYKEFDNFEDGWVFISEKVPTNCDDFDVKLYADWVAPNGKFYYTNADGAEEGTDKGRLHVGSSYLEDSGKYNNNTINIDLNGHKIDRNLKEPTENGSVFYIENGTVRIFDNSEAQTGMITGGNNTGNGGAFYVDNGAFNTDISALILEGGTISGNYAANGGGIYWNSDGALTITDGVISGNYATQKGGGLYMSGWGGIYVGGAPVIKDNYIKGTGNQSNLYLGDTDATLKLTRGQDTGIYVIDIPDIPLRVGAEIGISAPGDNEKLTNELSLFREEDFTYFFPDDTTHFVRSVHSVIDGTTAYDLYYTSWKHVSKRLPRVISVSVADNSLVKGFDFDYDKQSLTLTVANNKRDYFNMMPLDRLVSFGFNDQSYYLARIGNPMNLHERQQYRVMADNGTYVLLNVNIVPEGGTWAEAQDPYTSEYVALVYNEHDTTGYTDMGKAWVDAIKQSLTHPTTFQLLADWNAKAGAFYAEDADGNEYGTDDGYLDIDDENINLTIDLNGHAIDRNLDAPVSNGFVIYIGEGLVTVTDTSGGGNGKITGGNNTGDGGAFFMDNGFLGAQNVGGTLVINGGNITGNRTEDRGGAVYSESAGSVIMNGGKITNNTAEYGGAIALADLTDARLNGGEVSGNYATEYGGAFYCDNGGSMVIDGSTVVSYNTAPYGGCAYIGASGGVDFYSGYIKNNAADYGGGIYTYSDFVLAGSEAYLMDNVAKYDGGGIYASGSNSQIRANFGNITGNKAVNGAGIYWDEGSDIGCVLNNLNITKNEASHVGGGVYVADEQTVYVGGRTVIKDNTSSLGTDNLSLRGDYSTITHGAKNYFGSSLAEGAEIGIRTERVKGERIIVSEEGGFEAGSVNYFTTDDKTTALNSVADANYNGYKISLIDKYDGEMLVDVEWGDTKSFADFSKGWVYALQQSLENPTTITLGADWIARDGMFCCVDENGDEYGTEYGYLYINDNHILTIDLNGHKIDRNLSKPTENGVVFWLNDLDAKLTIKDSVGGGKITGANNDGDGGAFYVYNGSLYIEGGEITGNYADNGAGIYWYSDNNLCITGGKITGNAARKIGGGIYHEGGGGIGGNADNVYFGGNLQICGNSGNGYENNVYIKALRAVNRTAGQTEEIPNVPLVDGASIGISMADTEGTSLVSGPDSRFDSNNFGYFFGDNSNYFVRAVFDERIANSPHRLFYNKWSYKDAVYPKIKTVTPRENNGLISEASIDTDKQIITLKAKSSDKSLFKSVVVESLVSFTTSNDADVYWRFCDVAYDLSKPMEYKVVSKSTGTYVHCRVVVEFPECAHIDADNNYICEKCEEYIFTEFTIAGYNGETKKATVFAPKAGKYTLVFADYENEQLANVDIVEYDFKYGIQTIPQKVTNFALASGDKVMLLYDMTNVVPVCEAFTVK